MSVDNDVKCRCGAFAKPELQHPETRALCCSRCYDVAVGCPRRAEWDAMEFGPSDDYEDDDCSHCGGDGEVECDDYLQCTRQHAYWTHPESGMEFQFCACSACNGTGQAKEQVIW